MRGAALLGATCLAANLTASGAAAQDEGGLRLVFGIEERLEIGRNVGLEVPDEGSTTALSTTLSFGLFSATPLDRLEFTASTALVTENSPDTDGTETDLSRPTLGFSYTREIPDALFGISLRYVEDDVDALAEDLADADADGTETRYGITLRYETGRTTPVSFFAEAAYDVSDYQDTTDPDLVDTRTTALTAGTRLRFSEVLSGTFSLGYTREDEDGAADTTDTVTAAFGLERSLANGSLSLGLSLSSEDGGEDRTTLEVGRTLELPDGALSARLGISSSDLGSTDLVGGVDWTRTLPDGALSVSLERSASYDADDDETTVDTAFAVDWTREVNAVSSIGLDFSWALSDAPSERIEEASIGATYSRALTRDWRLDSGIRYETRDDADGWADSPSVFVALGRSFEIRP